MPMSHKGIPLSLLRSDRSGTYPTQSLPRTDNLPDFPGVSQQLLAKPHHARAERAHILRYINPAPSTERQYSGNQYSVNILTTVNQQLTSNYYGVPKTTRHSRHFGPRYRGSSDLQAQRDEHSSEVYQSKAQ